MVLTCSGMFICFVSWGMLQAGASVLILSSPRAWVLAGLEGVLLLVTILVILGRRAGCSLLGTQLVQTHTTVHLHVKSKRNSVLMPLISRPLVSLVGSCGGGVGGLAAVRQRSGTWLTHLAAATRRNTETRVFTSA